MKKKEVISLAETVASVRNDKDLSQDLKINDAYLIQTAIAKIYKENSVIDKVEYKGNVLFVVG